MSNPKTRSAWMVNALLLTGFLSLVVWFVPKFMVSSLQQRIDAVNSLSFLPSKGSASTKQPVAVNFKERLELEKVRLDAEKARTDAENAARTTLVQALGGLFLFITATSTWLGLRETQKTRKLAEKKQDAESFAKAVEWMSKEDEFLNLGGIHYLRQLAQNDPESLWPAIDVLLAHIRRSAWNEDVTALISEEKYKQSASVFFNGSPAITILKQLLDRENFGFGKPPDKGDLVNFNIQRLNLTCTRLPMARLDHSVLLEIDLSVSNLSAADLSGSLLNRATLRGCNLQGTKFGEADLTGADFSGSNLQYCDLTKAILDEADLTGVVKGSLTWKQLLQAKSSGSTKLPAYLLAPDSPGRPKNFDLDRYNREGGWSN